MKKLSHQKNEGAGFTTLELLIAISLMTVSMTAVIMVVFGNQSVAVDTELAQAGLYLAEQNLEQSGIQTIGDFNSLTSDPIPVSVVGTVFEKQITVTDISPCAKQIDSKALWNRTGSRRPSTTLSSVFVSADHAVAVGSNCSPVPPAADWDTPEALGSLSASDFHGQGTDISLATINNTPYAVVSTESASQDNLYIIDVSDPENVSGADIVSQLHVGNEAVNGLATVATSGRMYAFTLRDAEHGQLQVVDISNPATPVWITSASSTLPNITLGETPIPTSIYYYNQKLYIGTEYLAFSTPGSNHELHIYDVSNPAIPVWEASVNVNRNVNDIMVVDDLVYLATGPGGPPYTPFKVYNIDPSSSDYLNEIGSFSTPLSRQGTAVYALGNRSYLGLEKTTSGDDFYIIDTSNPAVPVSLGSYSLDGNNTGIGVIHVQGPFAFIGKLSAGVQDTLQVLLVSNPATAYRVNTCPPPAPLPQNLTGLAFHNDYLFASYRSNEEFRVLKDDPNLSCH